MIKKNIVALFLLCSLAFHPFAVAGAEKRQPAKARQPSSELARQPVFKGKRSRGRHQDNPIPKNELGMNQAVFLALKQNPALAAREAQTNASEAARKSQRGAFGPKLGTSYSAAKQERKSSPSSAGTPEYGSYAWTLEISQPVFRGGRLLAEYQKAALQADSDKAAVRNAELAMTEQVQTEFLLYLQALENVKSEAESLARLRDQLKITQAFYDVGLRPKLDVLQAEVDVSQSETTLIQMENVRDTAYARLNTLLGYPAGANISYAGKLAYISFKKSFEECLGFAYKNRPDLYMAKKAVEMAQKDQKLAQSGYYPQIEAYYNITQRGNSPDLQKTGNNGSRSTTWEAGLSASWDVFQWGTTYFDDKRAGWLVSRMKSEEEDLKLNVGYDVKEKYLAVKEAEKRINVAEKGIAQAMEAYEAALARYQEQVGTNFDVLNASSNLTRAQAELTSARADYLASLSRLYCSMGEFHPDLLAP